jgi:general secretion pathway protein K
VTGSSRQRGAALLIALLAVALAATMATGLVERGQTDVARAQAIATSERAWQYAAGLDALARDWIRRQREPGASAVMPSAGEWSQPLPVPTGSVQARVVDLGGGFNLNALTHPDPVQARAARRALDELLRVLNLAPELGADIAALVSPGTDGVAHRLVHLSELNRLDRMDPGTRARLAPHVVALPDPSAPINVNRASPEVLSAVLEGLSPASARAVLARAPFDSLQALLAQPELRAVPNAAARARLAVESGWFLAQALVRLDGVERSYARLVAASGNRYDARYVSQGTYQSAASQWLAPLTTD